MVEVCKITLMSMEKQIGALCEHSGGNKPDPMRPSEFNDAPARLNRND